MTENFSQSNEPLLKGHLITVVWYVKPRIQEMIRVWTHIQMEENTKKTGSLRNSWVKPRDEDRIS